MLPKNPTDDRSLNVYLREIGEISLLSREEEQEIARKAREGDAQAREKLIKSNLRFVVAVAKAYQNMGVPLQDLIGYGNQGLTKAADSFKESMGFKFISYAVWKIRQKILVNIASDARTVRLPRNRSTFMRKFDKEFARLSQTLGRTPTFEEIAAILHGVESFELKEVLASWKHTVSIDEPMNNEGETFAGVIEDEEAEGETDYLARRRGRELKREMSKLVSTLPFREAETLRFYFGLDGYDEHTLEWIGKHFSITRERARQLKEKALRQLRFRAARNKEYLEDLTQ